MKFQKGFTLIELMMAVAIVAILTVIAVPSYQGYVARAARANAEGDLMNAASVMERRKSQNFSYIGSGAAGVLPTRSPVDSAPGQQKYDIALTMWDAGGGVVTTDTDATVRYELRATSHSNFPGPQETLKINELGQKCYKKGAADCTIGTDPTWP
ncbi:MAG: type IV pilin protein [Pseudomonadota bacterium]